MELMNRHEVKKKELIIIYYNSGTFYFTIAYFHLSFIRNDAIYGTIKILMYSLKCTIKYRFKHISWAIKSNFFLLYRLKYENYS